MNDELFEKYASASYTKAELQKLIKKLESSDSSFAEFLRYTEESAVIGLEAKKMFDNQEFNNIGVKKSLWHAMFISPLTYAAIFIFIFSYFFITKLLITPVSGSIVKVYNYQNLSIKRNNNYNPSLKKEHFYSGDEIIAFAQEPVILSLNSMDSITLYSNTYARVLSAEKMDFFITKGSIFVDNYDSKKSNIFFTGQAVISILGAQTYIHVNKDVTCISNVAGTITVFDIKQDRAYSVTNKNYLIIKENKALTNSEIQSLKETARLSPVNQIENEPVNKSKRELIFLYDFNQPGEQYFMQSAGLKAAAARDQGNGGYIYQKDGYISINISSYLETNTIYCFSAWIKVLKPRKTEWGLPKLCIDVWQDIGGGRYGYAFTTPEIVNKWQKIERKYKFKKAELEKPVYIGVSSFGYEDEFYIDDITIEKELDTP